jgi:hypothetical protein
LKRITSRLLVLVALLVLGVLFATSGRADDKQCPPKNPHCVTTTTDSSTTTNSTSSSTTTITSSTTALQDVYSRPESHFGVSTGFTILNRTRAMQDFELDQIQATGAKLVRIDFVNGLEASTDSIVADMGVRWLEPWIVVGNTISGSTSKTAVQFGADCSSAATRYHGVARYYEAMNEPNSNGWTGAAYKAYLAACYNAIKAVDTRNIVVLGGLNPASQGTQAATWLNDLYAAGGKPFFDRGNDHPYGDPQNTKDYSLWQKTYGPVVSPNIVGIMQANGDGAKLLVTSEGGEKVGVNNCEAPDFNLLCTEQDQATTFSHYLSDARPFQEFVFTVLDDVAVGFGLEVKDASGPIVDPTGQHWRRRPAFATVQAAMGGTG